ncbi:MAG: hypothetical protein ACK54X_10460 [Burkholderiales bacterium]|jgi:hypothetical protein
MCITRQLRSSLRAASAAVLLAALAGCGTWTHPTKPESAFPADRMGCEQWAVGLYPVALVQRQVTPARQEPPKTSCTTRDAHTTCTTTPGAWVGPTFATEDAHASRRESAIGQCLRSAGWTWKLD